MKTLKLFFVIALFVLVACSHKSEVCQQLEQAEAFLCDNCVDSAAEIIKMLEPCTSEDSAYFFVIKAECDYRQYKIPNSYQLDYCINYYEKRNDFRRLCASYYYKSMVSVRTSSMSQADVILLKKAEQYADKTSDNRLKDKVSTGLRFVNVVFGEYQEALKYAKKEYNYAQYLTKRDVAYSLLSLSSVYRHLGNKDSAEYYVLQCKRLSSEVDDSDKSYIYNLLGECFVDENYDAALTYFKTALKYRQLPEIYKNIAEVYYLRNDTLNWRLYCDSAMVNASYDIKNDILTYAAQMYYKNNDFQNYKHTDDQLIATYQKQISDLKENYTLQIQKKYDFQKQQSHYENIFLLQIALIFFVIAVGAVVTLFYKRKIYKLRQRRLIIESENSILHEKLRQTNHQMNDYISQIDYLNNQNAELSANGENMSVIISNNEAYIADLKSKLGVLNNETKQSLEVGRVIYDKMCNNESISDYKNRLADGLFYFEVTYPECHQILAQYNNLTVSNMLFVLCDDFLHKDDEQIGSVFEISVSTVRSRRTKLKGKMS